MHGLICYGQAFRGGVAINMPQDTKSVACATDKSLAPAMKSMEHI